jgi:hypothetical protein
MAVITNASTTPGGVTPACSECGIALCWDISNEEYRAAEQFWDKWICADCNGGHALSLKAWKASVGQPA